MLLKESYEAMNHSATARMHQVPFVCEHELEQFFLSITLSAMKPAGAPSVRRSQSMNLNDMADRVRMDQRQPERYENAPSSYNSDYGGRDR